MDWQSLSTQQHAERAFTAALLPIGTIEAHDSGPVGTDNFIPEALCRRLGERLEMPVLPIMPYGVTASLIAYPGGSSLTPELLEAFLYELGKSLYGNGLRQLFVINGHGGNTTALRTGAARLLRDRGLYTAVLDWWPEAQGDAAEIFGPGGMGHAAIDEMGALLGFRPDLRDRLASGPVPSFYYYKGLRAYPAPRPTMTYTQAGEEVDFSRLTAEKCAEFAERITALAEAIIRETAAGWNAIGR